VRVLFVVANLSADMAKGVGVARSAGFVMMPHCDSTHYNTTDK
jgi:hypothetical protein